LKLYPIPYALNFLLQNPFLFLFLLLIPLFSATLDAAKGVAFCGPLNPTIPEEAHAKTFPLLSVMVIIVLL